MDSLRTVSVPALERGFAILETLAKTRSGLSLPQLAKELKLPKSSTHCLVLTLERRGYLQRCKQTGKYMFGLKLFSLAKMALAGIELRQEAAPFLKSLMESTRLTVHMAIREQNDAVLVEKVEVPGLLRLATWIGKRMDMHCTGVGKALLAYLSDEEVNHLITANGLPRHNGNTLASVRRLRDELAQIRKAGYSFDDEEDEIGLRCIGAPIFDQRGSVIAAVSVAGTVSHITPDNVTALAAKVKQAVLAISRQCGFDPSATRDKSS